MAKDLSDGGDDEERGEGRGVPVAKGPRRLFGQGGEKRKETTGGEGPCRAIKVALRLVSGLVNEGY